MIDQYDRETRQPAVSSLVSTGAEASLPEAELVTEMLQ